MVCSLEHEGTRISVIASSLRKPETLAAIGRAAPSSGRRRSQNWKSIIAFSWNDGIFVELPPPSPEVEAVLERALAQLLPDFESRGVAWAEDEYEVLQARSAQLRLPLDDDPARARRGRLATIAVRASC